MDIPDGLNLAVVVGTGSAGFRHASELRRQYPDLEVIVVRRPESTQPFERMAALDVKVVGSVEEAALHAASVAVVAGPASTHLVDSAKLAAAGSHLLVEKPLALNPDEARELVASTQSASTRLVVGYHLRCSSTVPTLRSLVTNGTIGTPLGFSFRVGQHLSQWRPGMDPSRSVTARTELGGGVLLELSHELDGVRFVLGEPTSCTAQLRRDGAPTDGLVETVADLGIELSNGIRGEVHLDMVSEEPFRTWSITGSEGTLTADLLCGTITVQRDSQQHEILHHSDPGERDLAERALIRNLIEVAGGAAEPVCGGSAGVAVLELVAAALTSDRASRDDPSGSPHWVDVVAVNSMGAEV